MSDASEPKKGGRLSEAAKKALVVAQKIAENTETYSVEPHHLLVAFLLSLGVANRLLSNLGLDSTELEKMIDQKAVKTEASNEKVTLSFWTKRLLEHAFREARALKHDKLGTGHLLLGLIHLQTPIANKLLDSLELSEYQFARLIRDRIFNSNDPKDGAPQPPPPKKSSENTSFGQMLTRIGGFFIKKNSTKPVPPTSPLENKATGNADQMILINNLLRDSPQNAHLYIYRASVHSAGKNYQAAISDLDYALRLKPDFAHAYTHRSSAKWQNDQQIDALSDIDKAIQLAPRNTSALILRASYRVWSGQTERALAEFEEVFKLRPNLLSALQGRATAYLQNRDFEKAIADCDTALRSHPDQYTTHHNRGIAYAYLGDHEKAEADFQAVLKLNPSGSYSYSNLGWLALLRKDNDEAIKLCDQAITIDSENGAALFTRGTAYANKGQHELAVIDYKQSLRYWKHIEVKLTTPLKQQMREYLETWDKQP